MINTLKTLLFFLALLLDKVIIIRVSLWGRISHLPEQQCWLYALDCSTAGSPLTRKFYPSGNWLSSRCLTSVIVQELVFPSWHQPLTNYFLPCRLCFLWLWSPWPPLSWHPHSWYWNHLAFCSALVSLQAWTTYSQQAFLISNEYFFFFCNSFIFSQKNCFLWQGWKYDTFFPV